MCTMHPPALCVVAMEVCNMDCGLMLIHRLNVFDVALVKGCSSESHRGPYARSTSYCSKLGKLKSYDQHPRTR